MRPGALQLIPTPTEARQHLEGLLARGSVNLGASPGAERLMLLVTRACELRCGYCHVRVGDGGPAMPLSVARRGVDWLMRSQRPRLELQLFGGEPTLCWETVEQVLRYARQHPGGRDHELTITLTTNGLGLTAERLALLGDWSVAIMVGMDGDEAVQRRQRPPRDADHTTRARQLDQAVERLVGSDLTWFVNAVVPPAASGEVFERYRWARRRGIPKLQVGYAVGMRWTQHQMDAYLAGLVRALRDHHADPTGLVLFDWQNDCEPVIVSDDLIVDVDGTIYHDAAVFLERSFSELAQPLRRGHVDGPVAFDSLRCHLAVLFELMVTAYPARSPQRRTLLQNAVFGAAKDLCVRRLVAELGGAPPTR